MRKSDGVFKQLKKKLHSGSFLVANRIENHYFCRERTLNFVTVILTLLNRLSKSLNVEVSKFLLHFKQGHFATKQAFSKARYKLKPEAFITLNEVLVEAYYSENTHKLYADKYLLLAVDGSNYELPWFEDIIDEFGFADNTQMPQPRAMATGVKIWDLLNEISVSVKLGKYIDSETALFDKMWPETIALLKKCQVSSVIFVADSYYPGLGRMVELLDAGVDFVIRCEATYCREVKQFMEGSQKEAILHIDLQTDHRRRWRLKKRGHAKLPAEIIIRAVRFELEDGSQGCILTSILDALSQEQIKAIYALRYGEETSFYIDKFRAQVENFATKKALGVYQEWYANILCLNMTQLLIEEAQKELDAEQERNPKKYRYKINKSVAIGLVKDEIPKILFGQEDIAKFNQRMINLIYKFKEPVRPGRSFPRISKHDIKYNMNQRKVL